MENTRSRVVISGRATRTAGAGGDEVRTTGVTVHGCTTLEGKPTRLPAWLVELAARCPAAPTKSQTSR